MEAGAQDDETKAAAAGAATPDGGSAGTVASRSAYTPLFLAQHEDRYLRRDLIKDYQQRHGCNLAVLIDQITQDSITLFAELLYGLDRAQDLHLLLASPGGDGGAAVRLARMAQAACRELVVIVPEMAKSAATILALGAHTIVMGPTSDLGPIDPQILVSDRGFFSAKDLIEAVNSALDDVATRPDTYPLHAAMLAGIDSTAVQFARSALASTDELAEQAISSNPDRTPQDIEELCAMVRRPLIDQPKTHSAVIGSSEARQAGLPVRKLEADDEWWQEIWQLWTRYYALGPIHLLSAYEGAKASQVRVLHSVGNHGAAV
ncbi:MAG: SDH family Clp fold serine proteinase [Pseudonocardiaceae bacterium]